MTYPTIEAAHRAYWDVVERGDASVILSAEPSEAQVEAAAIEYLDHRGERPRRIMRGGCELWETHKQAISCALKAARAAQMKEMGL